MTPPEQGSQVRAALGTIVAERKNDVLSAPAAMANLLKDLLPDGPKVIRMLVAAAEDRVADVLAEHMSRAVNSVAVEHGDIRCRRVDVSRRGVRLDRRRVRDRAGRAARGRGVTGCSSAAGGEASGRADRVSRAG